MSSVLDPVTLEILWQRLISVVDEADAAVARTAFSSLLRDAHDYTCMFTDRRGRELAQGTFATPGQAGAMALGIKALVKGMPDQYCCPGDVYITNDPWALAGHLNDVCVMSPIFHRASLVGFTACVFHHADVGGRVSSDNHDVYEDGLFIPLIKLHDAGVENEALLEMIRWNVRTPDEVIGDIRSQIAANHVCARQVCQMLDDYQLDDLDGLADEIIGRTERSMRRAIAAVPDGEYLGEGRIEQPAGREELLIRARVVVEGDGVLVDLDGSSPQVGWGGNVVFNFTYAYVFMAIKSMLDPQIPNNDGCAAPVRLQAPEGSVVNCRFPVAVAARMQVGHFMTEVIYRAMAGALPDRVLAGSGGTPATMNVFYGKWDDGASWHSVLIRGGGMGASAARDGEQCYIFPANGANTPAEILESDTPLLVERRELLCDSGGAGRKRGGLGRRVVFRMPESTLPESTPEAVRLGIQSGRFRLAPEGLDGGGPGALASFTVDGEPGDPYGLTQLPPGARVVMDAAGGGGYGAPSERDVEAVRRDVREGYVSPARAREIYRVALDADTGEVDVEVTAKLRAEE